MSCKDCLSRLSLQDCLTRVSLRHTKTCLTKRPRMSSESLLRVSFQELLTVPHKSQRTSGHSGSFRAPFRLLSDSLWAPFGLLSVSSAAFSFFRHMLSSVSLISWCKPGQLPPRVVRVLVSFDLSRLSIFDPSSYATMHIYAYPCYLLIHLLIHAESIGPKSTPSVQPEIRLFVYLLPDLSLSISLYAPVPIYLSINLCTFPVSTE